MNPYCERFPVGTSVRVADLSTLSSFLRPAWNYHHPVHPDHLRYAGVTCSVKAVGFYHGGDVLYQLNGVPGTWHEDCLTPLDLQS